jgi:hypothetical protein
MQEVLVGQELAGGFACLGLKANLCGWQKVSRA